MSAAKAEKRASKASGSLVLYSRTGKPRLRLEKEEEGDHSIEEAVVVFRRHNVPGLTTNESVRRALKSGRIPSKRIKAKAAPYRISLKTIDSILEKHTQQTKEAAENAPHKRLLEHFAANPLHTPVSAVLEGIVKSIHEARIVYQMFKKHQPEVRALDAFKKYADWETKQLEIAKQEPPCVTCNRAYFNARRESANVIAAVTGRLLDPWLHKGTQFEPLENETLVDYREKWLCSACHMWNVAAPIDEMKMTLASKRKAESTESDTETE
jgi:hypothetical protein